MLSVEERLASRVKHRSNGCIEWTGGASSAGYGLTRVGGKLFYTHRLAFEIATGTSADGLVIRHTCDNPPCINPAHLRAGSHADNIADKTQKGRTPRGIGHWASRLTEADIVSIRQAVATGTTQREVAFRYGVDPSAISRIATRRAWKHVM